LQETPSLNEKESWDPLEEEAKEIIHSVGPGESLLKIAYTHNVSERSILVLNNLASKQIFPGQSLKIPKKQASTSIVSAASGGGSLSAHDQVEPLTNKNHFDVQTWQKEHPGGVKRATGEA